MCHCAHSLHESEYDPYVSWVKLPPSDGRGGVRVMYAWLYVKSADDLPPLHGACSCARRGMRVTRVARLDCPPNRPRRTRKTQADRVTANTLPKVCTKGVEGGVQNSAVRDARRRVECARDAARCTTGESVRVHLRLVCESEMTPRPSPVHALH